MIELLIAMAVGMTILLAISSMMDIGLKSSSGVGRRVVTQQDARAVLDLMAMEIGMASFNPLITNQTWDNANNSCACVAMVKARNGIQVANANQIGVAMDLNGTTSTAHLICDVPNEYIIYLYDSVDNGRIRRAVSCGTPETILGGTGSSTMVRNNLTSPVTPLFQYFDVAGTDISDSVIATPDAVAGSGGIRDIRRIRINIVADVETQQGSAFRTTRRTYTTDVLVRNHAMQP